MREIVKSLIRVANELDELGLEREAKEVDRISDTLLTEAGVLDEWMANKRKQMEGGSSMEGRKQMQQVEGLEPGVEQQPQLQEQPKDDVERKPAPPKPEIIYNEDKAEIKKKIETEVYSEAEVRQKLLQEMNRLTGGYADAAANEPLDKFLDRATSMGLIEKGGFFSSLF